MFKELEMFCQILTLVHRSRIQTLFFCDEIIFGKQVTGGKLKYKSFLTIERF